MHKYRLVAKKGEGTFSEVLKAQSIKNGKYVAIKCMKNHFDSLDQVNNLREIQALRRLSPHANIIKLLEVLYDQPTGRLALVFELMDMNIYELIRGRRHYVAEDRVKNYMYQLMKGMDHMHRNGIFHRDIKPENILIMDDCLKLADFGSCRGIYSKQPYTEYISTRWYRAPECLLTDGYYNYKMDMWGVGCVFFEIVSLFPLFPGTNELDQIQKIHNILGTPPPELLAKMKKRSQHMDFNFAPKEGTGVAKLIPHVHPDAVDLIIKLLAYNPDERLSARQALRHPYFRDLREAEKRQKALATPDLSNHFVAMESDKVQQAQATISSNGSDHDNAHPSSPPESTVPTSSLRQTSDSTGVMNLPSIGSNKPMQQQQQQQQAMASQQQPSQLPPPLQQLPQQASDTSHHHHSQGHLHSHSHHHASSLHHDDTGGTGSMTESTYRGVLPGLHAQSSLASMDGPEDSALPPISNLSLAKQNAAGGGGGGGGAAAAHSSRRAAINYHDGGYAAAAAGKKPGGGANAAVSGVGQQGANTSAAAAAAAALSRRQSMGTVQAVQGKYGSQAAVVGSNKAPQLPQALHAGSGVSGAHIQAARAVAGADPGGPGGNMSFKYKANTMKTNSKYLSPYSLRQLAGQNAQQGVQ